MKARVLIIDDDAAFRFAMAKALSRRGYEVLQADGGAAAIPLLNAPSPPEAALLDLRMGAIDGLEVLRRTGRSPTRIIVLTGHGSVEAAVDAMKLGALSFLEKPVDAGVLEPLLRQAVAEHNEAASGRGGASIEAPPLIGDSAAMAEVRRFVERASPSDETVAVYGETGTGKEVVARHLHLHSGRRDRPFVALNAATVQRELFDSELFGHRKGAFTGALSHHRGMFGEANGGSLFIDEVAELPAEVQAKLLRALETGRVRPVGASAEVDVDVRIIAATNRDLWSEVQAGQFREDLYFRLQVLPVVLAPLRERPEDLGPLTAHLLARIDAGHLRISEDAREAMRHYAWPGNVRELLNVLRRAALFAESDLIDAELMRRMLAASVFSHSSRFHASGPSLGGAGVGSASAAGGASGDRSSSTSLAEVERAHIEAVLNEMGGNVTRAAAALGIDRRTLQRKLRGFG